MPFQQVNVAGIAPIGDPATRDLMDNLMKGYKAGNLPRNMAQQQQTAALQQQGTTLANQMQGMKNESYPEQQRQAALMNALKGRLTNAQIGLINAQAAKANRDANDPFGGQSFSGSLGQVMQLEAIRNKFGENSPIYQRALKQYNEDYNAQTVLDRYRGSLIGTAAKRASTTAGKTEQEKADIKAGFMPGTNRQQQLPPEDQQDALNNMELYQQKQTSDVDTRKRNLFATNIEKGFKLIDPKALTYYSGAGGALKLKRDELQSALGGTPSPYLIAYNENIVRANTLAAQTRQFYGESIQPHVKEELKFLTNPTNWRTHPDVALARYNAFKDYMGVEMGTYRGALKSRKEYEGQNSTASSSSSKDLHYDPATGGFK